MQILWLDEVDSTQKFLIENLKAEKLSSPTLVVAKKQSDGKGSRGNSWNSLEGNLFFSFAISKSDLPKDLPLSAASIYFSFLLKEIFSDQGSKVWMKWPNDFYLGEKKIGGTITNITGLDLVCGIGVNLQKAPDGFAHLDVNVDISDLLASFIKLLKNCTPWKKVLKKFEIEFEQNRDFFTHYQNERFSLADARLCDDGALIVDGKRIYSLR